MEREAENSRTVRETAESTRARRWWFWDRIAHASVWFAAGLWTLLIILSGLEHWPWLITFIAGLAMIGMAIMVILEIAINVVAWSRASRAHGAQDQDNGGGAS